MTNNRSNLVGLPKLLVEQAVRAALDEDLGLVGDITTDPIVSPDAEGKAAIVARESGVIGGLDLAETAFRTLDPKVRFIRIMEDGDWVAAGGTIALVEGATRALLTGERPPMYAGTP